jgi:DNA-binding CsgD family transcriptional regulator
VPQVPDLPDLSERVVTAYQRMLNGETLDPETPGLRSLLTAGLAADCPPDENAYIAIEPRYPALQMIQQIHTHLALLTAYTDTLPGFLANLRDRFQASRPPPESIQHLVGRELINEHIAAEHSAARKEIASAQPGHRTPDDLSYSFERDRAALKRGLAMRTMYHSSVRRVATIGDWAKNIATVGGEIRTIHGRFPRSIIFDRRVAFVPVYTSEGEPPANEAVMISDPLVVARIIAVYDLFWERAERWLGGRASCKGECLTTNAAQRAILRELCLGRNQKQAAKNLGISPAWVNNLMGELRKKLGVETLNEVIYWWATSPDHDAED